MTASDLRTAEFDYDLPAELIAQTPVEPRDRSRLLVIERESGRLEHREFRDIGEYLRPGDLLVANDSRVLPGRLWARRATGGRVELLLLRSLEDGWWESLVRPIGRLRPGQRLELTRAPEAGDLAGSRTEAAGASPLVEAAPPDVTGAAGASSGRAEVAETAAAETAAAGDEAPAAVYVELGDRTPAGGMRLRFSAPVEAVLARFGRVPLPPYIRAPLHDPERYQTVYSRVTGSAAAPTAGLHFTPELLDSLAATGVRFAFVTLHVGPDTFRPVRATRVVEHEMHAELAVVPDQAAAAIAAAKREGRRVVAVGTTAVRALESWAAQVEGSDPDVGWSGWTRLFIYPGYRFRAVDALITNFHLPRSTLLMLVSAFAGRDLVRRAYAEAIAQRYRFYSFGDCSLIV